jgi:Ca-activated chloride channel family protein
LNIQFQYPQLLWALAAIPVFILLYLLYKFWRKKTLKRIGDPHLVKELYKNYSSLKSTIKFSLALLAFAFGCIAMANPRVPDLTTAEARKGIDIMVALDVSNSMLANDVKPNRLTVAKRFISQLMNSLEDDRIGLVLFAGNAYVQMPLTFDHNAANMIVSIAAPSSFRSQGTVIGEALQKSDLAFQEESKRFKTIILITDGETHDENAVQQATELGNKGVMINTVGIGSEGGASIVDTLSGGVKKDLSGNIVVSKLNEPLLQQIASLTNGAYIRLNNTAEGSQQLVQHLAGIEKTALGDMSQLSYTSYYLWLAWPLFFLLVADIFISDKKKAK